MIQALVAGMQAHWNRHGVLANNLANVSTAGFKRDDLVVVPGAAAGAAPRQLGANISPLEGREMVQWTDFSQGPIHETGRNLDVALSGPGFFVVETPGGPRYTRAGALSVNRQGYLATPGGLRVLGERGPIEVRSNGVRISELGEVQEDEQTVDTLRVVDFPTPYRLLKEGNGLFVPADAAASPLPARGHQIIGGAVEGSNVNPVEVMVSMIELLRTYEASQRAIQAMEEANRQAIAELGRV